MTARNRWQSSRGLPRPTEEERRLGIQQLRALGFSDLPADTLPLDTDNPQVAAPRAPEPTPDDAA